MKRNPSVEFMRLIACLIVLACHCNLLLIMGDIDTPIKTYITGFLGDGVAIFWMITGFFIFNNTNYKKLWSHTLTRIVIPLLLLYIVDILFSRFLLGQASIIDSMKDGIHCLLDYLHSIITLSTPSNTMSHTWYVFAYLLVILIFPLLKAFADYLDKDNRSQLVFIIISVVIWVANDVFINNLLDFSFHGAGVIIPASLLIIWGHIIYNNRELLTRRLYCFISPIIFIVVNLLRGVIQTTLESQGLDDSRHLFVWYSVFGLINEILIITFCLSLVNTNKKTHSTSVICFLARYTYGIYLIHPLVQESALHFGFFDYIYNLLSPHMPAWAYIIIGILILTLLSFIACLIICIILRLIKRIVLLPFGSHK